MFPILAITSRITYSMVVIVTLLSVKWQRLSEAIFYLAVIFLCQDALLMRPDSTEWHQNPSTKMIVMIFVNIDKTLPQSLFVLTFWAVQYLISPWVKDTDNNFIKAS